MNMDDIPKFKQKTTRAFAIVNENKDKSNFRDSIHATGEKPPRSEGTNDSTTIVDDTRWFRAQYVENIGTAEGKNPKVRDVVKRLFTKRKRIQESDTYVGPVNPKTDAHLFTRPNASLIKKCLCGDFDCICKGCTLLPPKELPTGPIYWIDWNDFSIFKKPPSSPAGTLIPNLKAKLKEETESSAHLMAEGVVDRNQNCPEFCGSRCAAFKIPDADNDAKYRYTPEQLEKLKRIENTLKQQNRTPENKERETKNTDFEKNTGDGERK